MSSYACSSTSEASGEYSVAYTVAGLISIIVSCVRVVQCVGEMAHGSNRKVAWVAPRKSSQCFLYHDP